jgi:ABC-type amino acid transport substrate-binding protein
MCHPVVKIAVAAAIAASASAGALAQDAREILTPKGKLRVGAYLGSPLSMVKGSKTGEIHGLSVDLGKELAKRLDVPFEQVSYQRVADVLAGMKAGDVDFTVSNATPARAVDVNFSQTLISLELGYLVPAASPITTISDVDKPGIRVGVTQGSTSQGTIPKMLPGATVVPAQNLKGAMYSRPTSRLCLRCPTKCREREYWMADGAWSTSRSRPPRAAKPRRITYAASLMRRKPAGCSPKPCSVRASEVL